MRDPRAYLVRMVTRQALNRLRTLSRRRESYVGPWLPEPLLTAPDVADDVELAESVSLAMLVVLETLSPLERAVFVLREVFGFDYAEIAEATGQVAGRRTPARAAGPASTCRPAGPTRSRAARARSRWRASFFAAAAGGDLQQLMDVLAPDVVLLTDGGGKAKAALRPITGADKVARFLLGVSAGAEGDFDVEWRLVNGTPSAIVLPRRPAGHGRHRVVDGREGGAALPRPQPRQAGRAAGRAADHPRPG